MKPNKQVTIITLLKNGVSHREIHRQTNIDRKTIKKYAIQYEASLKVEENSKPFNESANTSSCLNKIIQYPTERPPDKDESKNIPSVAKSACAVHREWIEEQVRLGRNAMSIYQDLVERYNFTHKYNCTGRRDGLLNGYMEEQNVK